MDRKINLQPFIHLIIVGTLKKLLFQQRNVMLCGTNVSSFKQKKNFYIFFISVFFSVLHMMYVFIIHDFQCCGVVVKWSEFFFVVGFELFLGYVLDDDDDDVTNDQLIQCVN